MNAAAALTARRRGAAAGCARRSTNTAWARFRRHRLALFGLAVLVVFGLAAIFAAVLAGYDPNRGDLTQLRAPPSAKHLLGTDSAGRDVLARLLFGARISMLVGVVSVSIAALIGTFDRAAGRLCWRLGRQPADALHRSHHDLSRCCSR